MKLLKQSTSVTPKLGPALDATDGVTHETALTISQSDVILFKNHGAGAQKNDTNAATHDTAGHYGVPLNTTDTATLGPLRVYINESGALPFWEDYMVVTANVYDSLVGGSDLLQVDVDQIDGSASAATLQSLAALSMASGTVDNTAFTATTSVLETSSITTAASDHWVGRVIIFTSGTVNQQATRITAYSLSSGRGRFTYQTTTSAPASGVSFIIV